MTHNCRTNSGRITFTGTFDQCIAYRDGCGCFEVWTVDCVVAPRFDCPEADYWERKEYSLGAHFLPVIINGDASELQGDEAREFTDWQARETATYAGRNFHWAAAGADSSNFDTCAVSGMLGDCVVVYLMVQA